VNNETFGCQIKGDVSLDLAPHRNCEFHAPSPFIFMGRVFHVDSISSQQILGFYVERNGAKHEFKFRYRVHI
jgi:hypothetical protein